MSEDFWHTLYVRAIAQKQSIATVTKIVERKVRQI